MAGGGDVESDEAAETIPSSTVTMAMRQLTNSSWNESGLLLELAHLRLDTALWYSVSAEVSLSWSPMVLVMVRVFSAWDSSVRPSSQEYTESDSAN